MPVGWRSWFVAGCVHPDYGFKPGPSQWIFLMQKIDSVKCYGYTACKRSLECLFGLGALDKIKFLSSVLYRHSSGASLYERKWASKLLVTIDIPPNWYHTKK
ncbi:hypothetical protein TNCV_3749741 [Trichonephila clavipes]|nr:hypothetical protein TNCV_3749741 [Trichonephila clavipes]